MNRTERRRHKASLIKNLIRREIEEIHDYYNSSHWHRFKVKTSPEWVKTRIEQAVRHAHRDEGRDVRRKARAGRAWWCGCDWCVSNWTFNEQKERARLADEEKDYFPDGHYLGDYEWESVAHWYGWYPDPYDRDPESDWWYEWLRENGAFDYFPQNEECESYS